MTQVKRGTTSSFSAGLGTLWRQYLTSLKNTTEPWNLSYEEITQDLTPTLVEALIWKAMGGNRRLKMWIKPRYPLTNQKNLYNLWRKESESA